MKEIELLVGTFGVKGDERELVSFQGEELAKIEHTDSDYDTIQSSLTLYECSGGYRVILDLQFGTAEKPARITGVFPDSLDEFHGLLTVADVGSNWPALLVKAGITRNLDAGAQAITPEKRKRVANFGRIMRLTYSR